LIAEWLLTMIEDRLLTWATGDDGERVAAQSGNRAQAVITRLLFSPDR